MVIRRAARGVSLALALAVTACPRGPTQPPPSADHARLHQAMPDFSRPTLTGSQLDTQQLRGKVVVVEFFAEFCAPCKVTLPAAQRLHEDRPNVKVVGISQDEYPSQAQALATELGLTFPIVHDQDHVLAGRFRVDQMPTAIVIDGEGVVQWVSEPGYRERDLVAAVRAHGG